MLNQQQEHLPGERRVLPGPKGLSSIGISRQFFKNPLPVLQRVARKYGDIASFPLNKEQVVLFNHPEHIRQILILQQPKFHKSRLTKKFIGGTLGQGLLFSEGDLWKRQRRLAQPAFRRTRIAEYTGSMVEAAQGHICTWHEGEVRDLAEEMMAIICDIIVRTLFGSNLDADVRGIGRGITFMMRYQLSRIRSPFRIPASWPTRANRRVRRELYLLDSAIRKVIAQKQSQKHAPGDDLLSMLVSATDEDGTQMTLQQLFDETITFFLAGHETTASTLTWAWYLLSTNPGAEEKFHQELDSVLQGRPPERSDVERLPYLRAVLKEVLRLYSPASLMSRISIEPFTIGGYYFPKDTTVIISQWLMHRDPRFFDDPLVFRPERWIEGIEERLPAGAYFPFGDGPRRCIGQEFALLDTTLVLATIGQKFRFRLAPGHRVIPEQLVTLRPRHGLRVSLQQRNIQLQPENFSFAMADASVRQPMQVCARPELNNHQWTSGLK